MTMLFLLSIDGKILRSVLVCIDLHGSIVAKQLKKNISFTLYTGCLSKVHILLFWLRETKLKVHTVSHTNRSHLAT